MRTAPRQRPGVGRRTAHDPGDPLVTSHCPFCGSGQVVGRSDGTISCDFCGQNYIVRVQPAFPGAPQMPSGPGAPSDVGPDGGLLDPGMVGPDGMPPPGDGEVPPDDGEGPGAPDDGDDGGPPFGGGGDDDDGGKAKPKGKGSKKASLRRYHGVQGQLLTEEQLIRHLAAEASGHHPAVLAMMRRGGAREYPWYVPEGGGYAGTREFRSFLDQTDDRLESARQAANHALGIRRPTASGGGTGGGRIETGHHVTVNLDYPSHTWYAAMIPPSYPRHSRDDVAFLNLGKDDASIPQALMKRFSHPDVQEYLRDTMGR